MVSVCNENITDNINQVSDTSIKLTKPYPLNKRTKYIYLEGMIYSWQPIT